MSNPEGGMSPGEELARHQEQVKFRLGERAMAYRELWTPTETEEEKRLLEDAAIEQFTQAVNAGDWTRADAIVQDLRRQFGEPLLEVPPVAPEDQEKSEPSAIEKELHKMIDSYWKNALDKIHPKDFTRDIRAFMHAAEMRNFDPKRFDETVKLDESDLKKVARNILEERGVATFFSDAAALKKLAGPERFSELIPEDKIPLQDVESALNNYPAYAAKFCSAVNQVVPGWMEPNISSKLLEEKKKKFLSMAQDTLLFFIGRVELLGALSSLRQKGEKGERLSQSDWWKMKCELEDAIRHYDFGFFFYYANMVKKIGVEEE